MKKSLISLSLLVALVFFQSPQAQAERKTYLITGVSATNELESSNFNFKNELFLNHLTLERDLTNDFRIGLTYWNYGTARDPEVVVATVDPTTGFQTEMHRAAKKTLAIAAVTLSEFWKFNDIIPYAGIGLGVFRQVDTIRFSYPKGQPSSTNTESSDTWYAGARMLFFGLDFSIRPELTVGLSLHFKKHAYTGATYADQGMEIKYCF